MKLKEREVFLTALGKTIQLVKGNDILESDSDIYIQLSGLAAKLDAAIAYSVVATTGNSARALVAVNSDRYCPESDEALMEAVGKRSFAGLFVYDMKRPAVAVPAYLSLGEILFVQVLSEDRNDVENSLDIYQTNAQVLMGTPIQDFQKILPKVETAMCLDQSRGATTELEPLYRGFLEGTLNVNYPNLPKFPQIELKIEQTETKPVQTE